jgi:hypothetical protein
VEATRGLRFALTLSGLLATASVAVAFAACPEAGSAYLRLVGRAGTALPLLTDRVALPLLRVTPGQPHDRPHTVAWAALVWALLAAGPPLVLGWSLRARRLDECVARWVAGMSAHLALAALVAAVVVAGLVLPLACL